MRPFERRQTNAYPYFKLATWSAIAMTFADGRQAFATEAEAKSAAKRRGRYRISVITPQGRRDLPPFEV